MGYITAIGTANPEYRFNQGTIADFMLRAMDLHNGDERKLRTIFRSSGIEYRYSVLEDYGKNSGFTFFPDTPDLEPFPSTERRLQMFRRHALNVSVSAFQDMMLSRAGLDQRKITHVIVVCCTGMYAPGLDIDLVHALNLKPTVQRTAINFMGCHAAFTALKIADALCRSDDDAKVLVMCTEFCSLHFQREATEDNLIANALFGDGSAAVLVEARPETGLALHLEDFHSDLASEGKSDMAWTIGNLGFEMRLTSFVPGLIRKGIADLANNLLRKISAERSAITHFAIHPGGKRILQAIQAELEITPEQNHAAYKVLKNYGNMSSATVLFVLRDLLVSLTSANHGERILSMAFGPGLTLESMVLRIENVPEYA